MWKFLAEQLKTQDILSALAERLVQDIRCHLFLESMLDKIRSTVFPRRAERRWRCGDYNNLCTLFFLPRVLPRIYDVWIDRWLLGEYSLSTCASRYWFVHIHERRLGEKFGQTIVKIFENQGTREFVYQIDSYTKRAMSFQLEISGVQLILHVCIGYAFCVQKYSGNVTRHKDGTTSSLNP